MLVWGSDQGPVGITSLSLSPAGLAGRFRVTWRDATTLRLQSGGPFIIKEIRLEQASTFSAPDGLIP